MLAQTLVATAKAVDAGGEPCMHASWRRIQCRGPARHTGGGGHLAGDEAILTQPL